MNKNNIENFSIFGEYKQPENRVTAALLHIMREGGEPLINFILGGDDILPNSEIQVQTQDGDGESIPDGHLSCNFTFNIYIESKIKPNSINKTQLENHCKKIQAENDRLIYLTPDEDKPKELNGKAVWHSWNEISEKLGSYLKEHDYDANSKLYFLVDQFQLLLENMDLLSHVEERVMIVGGSFGENIARQYNFYCCQNNRVFKKSRYLAFAYNNRIQYLFEIVGEPVNDVDLESILKKDHPYFKEGHEFKEEGCREKHEFFKLKQIKEFNPVIENNNTDKNGVRCAFVQSQTYTTLKKITNAKMTSDL